MTKDEAMKMALEALEADELDMVDDGSGNMVFRKEQAITAMEKLLAQPEQEPVGKLQEPTAERAWFTIAELNAWADKKLSENPHWVMPTEEPEREWVGLTDEETETLVHRFKGDPWTLIEEVSARLEKRNT